MDTNKRSFDIVNGPSRDRLFDACKYAFENKCPEADFSVAAGYTRPKRSPECAYIRMEITEMRILAIEHLDYTGNSLLLKGSCKADLDPDNRGFHRKVVLREYGFEAEYNVKTRNGKITFSQAVH